MLFGGKAGSGIPSARVHSQQGEGHRRKGISGDRAVFSLSVRRREDQLCRGNASRSPSALEAADPGLHWQPGSEEGEAIA